MIPTCKASLRKLVVGWGVLNDLHRTLTLTKSLIDHGKLSKNPSTFLQPYSQTTFKLTSPVWNDRIEYSWGYQPTEPWCGQVPSQVDGTYKYTLGLNSCDASNVLCPSIGNMTVIVEGCDDSVGTSNPE